MRCLATPAAACFFAVMALAAAASAATEFVGPNPAMASLATEDHPAGVAEVITHPDGTRTRIFLPQALGQGMAMISRASPDDALIESVGVARDPSGISALFLQRGGQATAPFTRDHRPLRQMLGEYAYTALSDGRPRGWERFVMTVHEDGSRSLLMWNDIHARRTQMTTLVLVDADFLPRAGWANYWNEAGYKGSALLKRESGGIAVDSRGAWGRHQETITVDGHFSLGTHPVAGDGWHVHDGQAQVFALAAGPDPLEAITGSARSLPVERVGEETLSVPAGRFDTVHWRLAGRSDVWVHGEDRIVIRMRQAGSDREYVLTSLESRP